LSDALDGEIKNELGFLLLEEIVDVLAIIIDGALAIFQFLD